MTATSDLIAAARSHSIGDIPRRTAARVPHKTAIVNGDVRLTFAELDAVIDRTAAALAHLGMAIALLLLLNFCSSILTQMTALELSRFRPAHFGEIRAGIQLGHQPRRVPVRRRIDGQVRGGRRGLGSQRHRGAPLSEINAQ